MFSAGYESLRIVFVPSIPCTTDEIQQNWEVKRLHLNQRSTALNMIELLNHLPPQPSWIPLPNPLKFSSLEASSLITFLSNVRVLVVISSSESNQTSEAQWLMQPDENLANRLIRINLQVLLNFSPIRRPANWIVPIKPWRKKQCKPFHPA